MAGWLKRLGIVFIIILTLSPVQSGQKVMAASDPDIPIRVAVLYDSTNANANLTSTLYNNVVRVLQWNKLPFDSLDISGANHPALLDASGNLKYSAAIIEAEGVAIDTTNSQNILGAINRGMGAISVLPTSANDLLKQAFGIATIGSQQVSASSFIILKDKFTFAYAGAPVNQASLGRNHTLMPGADIVATFVPDNQPAIWTYIYGAGKTVFHNSNATNTISYWGILLQSILYVMPIGVASPANVMAVDVDDCPMPYYSADYTQHYYYDFMTNYLRWLAAYHVKSTFYIAFSYSGNISDFWSNPEPLQAVADIIRSGNEVGLHAGSQHLPLDAAYWGSPTNVDGEVNTTNLAINMLKQKLFTQYGLTLGDLKSYVAPGDSITDYGYQVLNKNTTIKYVGESFAPRPGQSEQVAQALSDTIGNYLKDTSSYQTSEKTPPQAIPSSPAVPASASETQYVLKATTLQSASGSVTKNPEHASYNSGEVVQLTAMPAPGWIFVGWSGSKDLASTTANPTIITMNNNETVEAFFSYPAVVKDFGQEGNYHLYNLPRIQGGFEIFNHPQDPAYSTYQNILRTSLESGQPYILYTHPPESDLTDKTKFPDATMATVFGGMSSWANYIATNYPFYRWKTSSQVGDFLSSRSGTLSAQWTAANNTLQITLAQPDDPLHVKTTKYLNGIRGSGNNLTLTFIDTPYNFQSDQYDVIRLANDYFIYPRGQKAFVPLAPAQPFVFQPVTPQHAPILNPIGNKQDITGQLLSFTVSGIDPDGKTLSYSASNLPAGATFDPSIRTFSWTPTTEGVYSSISFVVSDGLLTASEVLTITVTDTPRPDTEINQSVGMGRDDGYSGSGSFQANNSWYEGGDIGSPYNAWFRFNGISIPKGATIVNAHLQTVQSGWTKGTYLKISAEKAAAPGAPTSTADHFARVRTTAGINWTSGYSDREYHNSPDLASIIQELVNSYDYSDGGSIQILVDNNGSTTGAECTGETFESGIPPRLDIVYRTGSSRNQYTLTINTSGPGTVAKNPEQTTYNSGDSVPVTAIPAPGWSFSGWSGDLNENVNPATIKMNSNKTVTATFTQNPIQRLMSFLQQTFKLFPNY